MPTLESEQNSIQMVPIEGRGFGSALVGMAVYFSNMAVVGLKEVFIFLRLGGECVSLVVTGWTMFRRLGGKQTQAHRWSRHSSCENRREIC